MMITSVRYTLAKNNVKINAHTQPEPEAQESLKPSEHRRSLKGQPKESST